MTLNMKFLPLVLGLCACLCVPRPALAIYMTGQELEAGCMAEKDEDISFCFGYIAGVIDYHMMLQSLGTSGATDFCLPEGTSVQQAALAVISYMEKAPQNGAFIAAPAIIMGLSATYPCAAPAPRKKKRR